MKAKVYEYQEELKEEMEHRFEGKPGYKLCENHDPGIWRNLKEAEDCPVCKSKGNPRP